MLCPSRQGSVTLNLMDGRTFDPRLRRTLLLAFWVAALLSGCGKSEPATPMPLPPAAVQVVVDGLFAPMNMAALPDGGLLIAEAGTGERDDSAGVTLLTADGAIGRLVSGLPSSRDSGDLAGVSLVSFSPDSSTIFIGSFGAGHLWTLPLTAGERTSGLALPPEPYRPEQLGQAMAPLSGGRLVNPFDMTYDVDGKPVVSYSDDNGVAIETIDGATRFVHRSEELPNPELVTGTVEAVPTGITRIGGEYYVSLTNGCPFPTGAGQIVAVDLDRNQRTVLDGLNMPDRRGHRP